MISQERRKTVHSEYDIVCDVNALTNNCFLWKFGNILFQVQLPNSSWYTECKVVIKCKKANMTKKLKIKCRLFTTTTDWNKLHNLHFWVNYVSYRSTPRRCFEKTAQENYQKSIQSRVLVRQNAFLGNDTFSGNFLEYFISYSIDFFIQNFFNTSVLHKTP